jgi:hypothetical protein
MHPLIYSHLPGQNKVTPSSVVFWFQIEMEYFQSKLNLYIYRQTYIQRSLKYKFIYALPPFRILTLFESQSILRLTKIIEKITNIYDIK